MVPHTTPRRPAGENLSIFDRNTAGIDGISVSAAQKPAQGAPGVGSTRRKRVPERVATENRFFEFWGTLATPASPWGALAEEPRPATPGQVKGSQAK